MEIQMLDGLLDIISKLVTIVGFPFAVFIFLRQRAREQETKERLIYESLSTSYEHFLRLVLENPDLHLWTKQSQANLSPEQQERLSVLMQLLLSLFERAYILGYTQTMTSTQAKWWRSWDRYVREWCEREDFRRLLPVLLRGDDAGFVNYIMTIAATVEAGPAGPR